MKFENFITRINEENAQDIIGISAIQILNTLNTDLTRLSLLQSIILSIYSPIELLTDTKTRNELFDLLKPGEAQLLTTLLGKIPDGDIYESLKSNKFTNKGNWKTLLEYFEIIVEEETQDVTPIHYSIINVNYPLFLHQRKAINELKIKLYTGRRRVMLHMPTGSGKTRTAMNIICDHFRLHNSTIVLWLAHTEELCEQAASEFEKAWTNLGDRNLSIIRHWGASSENIANLKDGFIVGGISKITNLLKVDASAISTLAGHCTLVIMDEAHMAVAPTFKLNLKVLTTFNASLLGLSATPGRTWNDPDADLELSEFFNKQKVTLKIDGYENPVDYLIDEGYLAKVINTPLLYHNGFSLSEHDLSYLKNNFQLSDKVLKRLSEDQQRNILIIQKLEELFTRHTRIIVFAMNVAHSNLIAICLQARGINAFSITSDTESGQRKKLIERFKSNEENPLILCNYGILTTGFDAPKTSCALISRPTDSLVLYSQMVGRAIRGIKAGGNKYAEIITVVDTCLPGFDKVASAFFNWEDIW